MDVKTRTGAGARTASQAQLDVDAVLSRASSLSTSVVTAQARAARTRERRLRELRANEVIQSHYLDNALASTEQYSHASSLRTTGGAEGAHRMVRPPSTTSSSSASSRRSSRRGGRLSLEMLSGPETVVDHNAGEKRMFDHKARTIQTDSNSSLSSYLRSFEVPF